jgi:ubiquinol-cytochrome c reductase cytochrome b subunit
VAAVTSASQPDWYVAWLDGALRVMPNLEIHVLHHTIGNTFFPGVLLPGITFGLLYAWPFLEARVTRDGHAHNLLDRPRDRPARTAFGAATVSFYVVLVLAGGTDVLASTFGLSFESLLRTFQVACVVVPVLVGLVTWRVCREISRQRIHPIQRPVGGVIVRGPDGGYELVGAPDGHGAGHEEPAGAPGAPAEPARAPTGAASGDGEPKPATDPATGLATDPGPPAPGEPSA